MTVPKDQQSSHLDYLRLVALPNCAAYYSLLDEQLEQGQIGNPASCERLRRFLNAVDSLDNVLDSFFHDYKSERGWAVQQLGEMKGVVRANHVVLSKVHELAVALTQRPTRSKRKVCSSVPNAPTPLLSLQPTMQWFEYLSAEDAKILESAHQFWLAYLDAPDLEFLLRGPASKAWEQGPAAE